MSLYYSPERHGARIIGDVDTIGGYEFNMLAVFQRESDGALFYDTDSGCSCRSPFEDAEWGTMLPIRTGAWFAGQARKWVRDSGGNADDRDAIEKLIVKVRQILREAK